MKRKIFNQCMVVILIALTAASCSKPASVAPQATPTALGDLPFPLATQPNIMNEILFGTQTAEAMGHEVTGLEGTMEPTLITDLTNLATDTGMMEATASEELSGLQATVAATKTKTPVATATPGRPETYTVHKGEFPYCLARRFNVSAADLLNLNGLGANTHVSEGTVLQIPQDSEWNSGDRALKSHPTTYTVVSGDTIYSIACEFGDVDPNAIIAANGLEAPYDLTGGTELDIP